MLVVGRVTSNTSIVSPDSSWTGDTRFVCTYINKRFKALFRSTDSSNLEHFGPKTLQTWDTSDQGHFSTSAEMSVRHLSVRHFGTDAKVFGHFRVVYEK